METILAWSLVIAAIAIVSMLVLLIASEREVKRKRLEADSLRAKLESAAPADEGGANLLVHHGTVVSAEVARLTEQVRANEVAIATLQCELESLRAENSWLKQESGAYQIQNREAEPGGREHTLPAQDERLSALPADFRLDSGRSKSRLIVPAGVVALFLIALVGVFFARGRTALTPVRQGDSGSTAQIDLAAISAVATPPESDDFKPETEPAPKTSGSSKRAGQPAGTSYEVVRSTRVFSQPEESSRPLARIEAGMEVNVVGERDEWLEVRSRHGRPSGFIRKDTAVHKRLK